MKESRAAVWLRRLSGVLAGGMVALAVTGVVAVVIAQRNGWAGPGTGLLFWQVGGAVVAVAAQVVADRRGGGVGVLGSLVVVLIAVLLLATQWLR
jgi:hypothetical protein